MDELSIVCVIHANKVGGTERVATMLASEWSRAGHKVCVIESSRKNQKPFYALDPLVSNVALGLGAPSKGLGAAMSRNVGRIRALRRSLRRIRPDIVVSFLTEQNVVTILATIGLSVGLVVSERTDPVTAEKSWVWRMLRWMTYRCADRVVVLNERARKYFEGSTSAVVIANPVPVRQPVSSPPRSTNIVGMGRLVVSKQFDLLLKAFAKIAVDHPSWRLLLIGEGPEEERLRSDADRLGIAERVCFRGSIQYPESELRRAAIFVSCSILEGFPMAICEAMGVGTPVVVAAYNESVREIIQDGRNGLIVAVEDEQAVAAAIARLINDNEYRFRLGEAGRKSMYRYAPEVVVAEWIRMFREIKVLPSPNSAQGE